MAKQEWIEKCIMQAVIYLIKAGVLKNKKYFQEGLGCKNVEHIFS
jgi:hypothetical protein